MEEEGGDEEEEVEETEEEVKKVEENMKTEIVLPPPAALEVAAAPAGVVAPDPTTAVASQITGSDTKDVNNDTIDIFEDDGKNIEEVKILEDIPPEPLEDFVDLDSNQNMMPIDFEELA